MNCTRTCLGPALLSVLVVASPAQAPGSWSQPVAVVANAGQWPTAARLQVRQSGLQAWGIAGGLLLQVESRDQDLGAAVVLDFEGAAGDWQLDPADRLAAARHYLLGDDPAAWRTDVPSYRRARLPLHRGAELVLGERDGRLCYDLVLRPGAQLGRVRVHVLGAEGLLLAADGSLRLQTVVGELQQTPPRTWVERDGVRTELASRFVLLGTDRYGFAVDGWDGTGDLVVDPGLIWGSFLGGAAADSLDFVALDTAGRVVTAGNTRSSGLPTTPGAYRPSALGSADAVVAVFASSGGAMLSCTYYGGSGDDTLESMQLLQQNRIAIGGTTNSTNLATSGNAFQSTPGGGRDAFAAIFNSTCTALEFGTYYGLGGDQHDIRIWLEEGMNNLFITGRTNATVAATAGAYQGNLRGPADLFLAVLNRNVAPASLLYGSMYGGDGDELAVHSIHVAPNGIATMGVTTNSVNAPATSTAYQSSYPGGATSGLIVCLTPFQSGANSLVYASYFGGNGDDQDLRLEMDPQGFFTAIINSASTNWPASANAPFATHPGGSRAGVVCRINPGVPGNAAIQWLSYLGGSATDRLLGFFRDDGNGIVAVCGTTTSSNAPTTSSAMQLQPHGGSSGYLAVLDPGMNGAAALRYASYFDGCGTGDDELRGIRRAANGELTVVGNVTGSSAPVTGGAFQRTNNGAGEGVVARIDGTAGIVPFRVFGTGCGSPGGVPQLAPDLPPRMCLPFRVQLSNLRPSSVGVMVMGLSSSSWLGIPLPRDLTFMGMTSCTQYVSVDETFFGFTGTGTATFGFTLPPNPLFYGIEFFLQYGVFDSGANPFGLVWSNAGAGTIVY